MTEKLPPELLDMVFRHSDPLTKYLNNRFSNDEIKSQSANIWNEAFHQNWEGDLELLPKYGLPDAR
ncbi:hypothetical protein HDU76_007931, partial [Blyttiomyces sp. JEL0837]